MKSSTKKASAIMSLVFRAGAMARATAVVVMSILGTVETQTLITLLGIGLFTLALDALDREPEVE